MEIVCLLIKKFEKLFQFASEIIIIFNNDKI